PIQIGHAVLQELDADEEQSEAGQDESVMRELALAELIEQHAHSDERQRQLADAVLQTDECDEPACAGRAQIGTEYDTGRLHERQHPCADEAYGHKRCSCRGLYEYGDRDTCANGG